MPVLHAHICADSAVGVFLQAQLLCNATNEGKLDRLGSACLQYKQSLGTNCLCCNVSCVPQAQLLCKATYEGKLDRLSNLLRAGCQADAHDYDGQTALHVAAADANLPAVSALCLASAMQLAAAPLADVAEADELRLCQSLSACGT